MHKDSSTLAARSLEEPVPGAGKTPDGASTAAISDRSRLVDVVPIILASFTLLLVYVSVYPLHGWHVALGADTPVYVWWTRLTTTQGLRAPLLPARPGTLGSLADLTLVLPEPASAVIASATIAIAVGLSMAAGSFVEEAFAAGSLAYVATVVATGAFCFVLVGGYVSTLVFGCLFVAALALIAHGLSPRASPLAFVGSVLLLGIAALAHPIFWVLGSLVLGVASLSLLGSPKLTFGGRIASPTAIVLAAAGGATALTLVGLAATGWVGRTPLDTSADAILRRLQPQMLVAAYRSRLGGALVASRPFLVLAAMCPGALVWASYWRPGSNRAPVSAASRFGSTVTLAWLGLTLTGIAALGLGIAIPAQRLVNFSLAVPILTGAALVLIRVQTRPRRYMALAIFVAIASSYFAWHAWTHHKPPSTAGATVQAARVARVFASTPTGTSLIVVTDSREKPAQRATMVANLLRDYVPPSRLSEVHVYLGRPQDLVAQRPTLTGRSLHDQLSQDYWHAVMKIEPTALVVVMQALDPSSYSWLSKTRGATTVAPGVIALANQPSAPVLHRAVPASPLWSSWLPVWLAPALLVALLVGGWPWVRLVIPNGSARSKISLAPALGLGVLAAAAMVVDASGLRIGGSGAWVAVIAVLAGPQLLSVRRKVRATSRLSA